MRWGVFAAIAIWWLWPHHHREVSLQVGATSTGFVARVDRDIVVLGADGTPQRTIQPDLPEELRVVGAGDGIAVGWRDGARVAVAMLADDGALVDTTHWGRAVEQLCDGAASNAARFGIAWAEQGGNITVVNGPVAIASTAPKSWCGVASAGERIALLWRDSGRVFLNFCDRQRCENRPIGLPIERSDQLIGYGCTDAACLFAVRHKAGDTDLVRLTTRGQMLVRPFEPRAERVAIVGTGDAFAIGYPGQVERVAMDGARSPLAVIDGMPALAWGRAGLLVAYPSGDGVRYLVR